MATEKNVYSRIQHKHDIEANWIKASSFIPKQGEIIIYDVDEKYYYERIKIGDGVKNVNDLPFVNSIATNDEIIEMLAQEDMVPAVTDADGGILADENENILLW